MYQTGASKTCVLLTRGKNYFVGPNAWKPWQDDVLHTFTDVSSDFSITYICLCLFLNHFIWHLHMILHTCRCTTSLSPAPPAPQWCRQQCPAPSRAYRVPRAGTGASNATENRPLCHTVQSNARNGQHGWALWPTMMWWVWLAMRNTDRHQCAASVCCSCC